MQANKETKEEIRQGDIVDVDDRTLSASIKELRKWKTKESRRAIVISNNKSIARGDVILVIPIGEHRIYSEDVLLRKGTPGLYKEESHAHIKLLQAVPKTAVLRRHASLLPRFESVVDEVKVAIVRELGIIDPDILRDAGVTPRS